MLAADVLELHREGVAGPGNVLVVQDDGHGEAVPAPAPDHGCQRFQHLRGNARDDDRDVQVGASCHPFLPGGAAVEDDGHELSAERLFELPREGAQPPLGAGVGSRHARPH